MTFQRRPIYVVIAALMMAGCATPEAAPPSTGPPRSPAAVTPTIAAPTPTPTTASDFCLGLPSFEVGALVWRDDVVKGAGGESLDIKGLRERAALIELTAKGMQESVPPDIAKQFRAVRKAIKTSASRLKAGAKVRDVLAPLYGKRIISAFLAVSRYEGCS
ncbi:hypothetical protein ABZ897_29000 [Nonomuraea sp. NPDC046802]|uniref:hypothetical protein n=1 Tax=Nonomuraea sp. NPDC046802 TaxID=3154919 RepID=UPI0033C1A6CF